MMAIFVLMLLPVVDDGMEPFAECHRYVDSPANRRNEIGVIDENVMNERQKRSRKHNGIVIHWEK